MNGSVVAQTTKGDTSDPFWQGLADTEFVSTFCEPVGFEHLDRLEIGTLTPCFEEVVILGTIHGLTLILSLIHVARLSCGTRVAHAQISSRKWQRIKACLIAISALIPLMQLNAELGRTSGSIPPFELLGFLLSIAALLSLLTWLLVELTYGTPLAPITTDGFGRTSRARGKGRWQQWFLFMFLLAGHTIKARRFVITGPQRGASYFLWLYGVQYVSIVVLCVLEVSRPALFEGYQAVTHEDDEAMPPDDAQMAPAEDVCPEQRSSLWSQMTFSWITPLLKIGYKRALTPDDIFKIDRQDQTVTNEEKFNRLWRQEWVSKGHNASLLRVLLACFGRDFVVGGLYKIGNDASQFVGPIALGGLLQFINDRSQPDWVGYSYALLLLVGQILGSLCEVQYFQRVMRVGMQVRAVLIAAGYRKSVSLGPKAAKEFGSGKLANLLSNDTDSLKDCCQNLHTAWSSPLRIVVALGMLLSSLGPSALTAVVVIVAFIPIQAKMAKLTAKFKKETAQFTDSRLKVSGELFGAMAIVKMYAWETAFEGKVNTIRNDELVLLRRSSMFSAMNTFLINVNPVLVSLLTFVVYAVTEGDLTAEVAFTALSLFNILRMPMIMLPNVITSLTTAQVSVERLNNLFVADEVDETSFTRGTQSHMTSGPLISVSRANFSWDPSEPHPTLRGVQLEVNRGQVVVVIGTTGSGKSSLLSALLQELPCVTNQSESPVTMTGSIAYAAQQSWLFNASVRENIIFGLPYDHGRYYEAVRVAQLERDFELMPAADETEIGEKGSNLSGGQRQRISLARAAYAQADIYLLDDPLSALDAKVGRLVFEQLVMGTLRSSAATIMVTNQLQYCSHADQVVVMKHGEIAESGSYEELLHNRGEFFELMREHGGHDNEEEASSNDEGGHEAKPLATKQTSASSKPPHVESQPAQSGKLMSAEGRSKGTVSVGVIMSYVAKAGGTTWFAFVSLTFVLVEVLRALSTWWLGVWSSSGGSSIAYYMGIYAMISIVMALCQLYNAISLVRGGLQAAKNFWNNMFDVLLHAPMSFYATTPLGRIINRLTGDMSGVDQRVAPVIGFFIRACIQLIGALAVIGGTTPYTLATFVPILYMFYVCQNYYQRSARELKRMDAVSRSPINSHLNQTIDGSGVATIRAYGAVERMCLEIAALIDNNSRFYLAQISANRWLSCRLEAFGGLLVFSVGVFAVFGRAAYDSTIIGMSLSNALQITSLLNIVVRVKTMAEMQLNSVERVEEYTQIGAEALHVIEDHRPPHRWPQSGSLEFENVQMRYRDGLPLTLKGCSFSLSSGDRCGVVGRTGAGKSSLLQALFRLCEIEDGGRIILDGQNLAEYGLTDVRSKIAIIPQEPVIFSGTVRSNLDPFADFSDSDIWKAIERAKLYDAICAHPLKLDRVVAEGGTNFSIGQRQLICLARAILKGAAVLCLDEATANIDVETDALIQLTVRNEFSSATTLTIAHRLNTIIDSDVILVLDAGKVAEFDTPAKLLARDTIFSSMVDSTGPATSAFLRKIAIGELRPEHEEVAMQSLTQTNSRTGGVPAANITTPATADSVEDVRRAIGVVLSALQHPNKLIDKQDLSQESWNTELQAMLGQVMAEAHSHHLLGSGTLTMLSADAIEHDMHDAEHRTLSNLKTH